MIAVCSARGGGARHCNIARIEVGFIRAQVGRSRRSAKQHQERRERGQRVCRPGHGCYGQVVPAQQLKCLRVFQER